MTEDLYDMEPCPPVAKDVRETLRLFDRVTAAMQALGCHLRTSSVSSTTWAGDNKVALTGLRYTLRILRHDIYRRNRSVLNASDERRPRGWVFANDVTGEEVGFAEPGEYPTADHAVQKFGNEYVEDFGVYFRDSRGVTHSCEAESKPDDFD